LKRSISSHPNIAEVAVVGVADQLKGQVAMAFAIAKDASALGDAAARLKLEGEVMKVVDSQLGAVARPARVLFCQRFAQNTQRQITTPSDPSRLRKKRSWRFDDYGRSASAQANSRCNRLMPVIPKIVS